MSEPKADARTILMNSINMGDTRYMLDRNLEIAGSLYKIRGFTNKDCGCIVVNTSLYETPDVGVGPNVTLSHCKQHKFIFRGRVSFREGE